MTAFEAAREQVRYVKAIDSMLDIAMERAERRLAERIASGKGSFERRQGAGGRKYKHLFKTQYFFDEMDKLAVEHGLRYKRKSDSVDETY